MAADGLAGDPPPVSQARLPELVRAHAFDPRATAAIRSITDVDLLPDGRIVVLDFRSGRVSLFGPEGRFGTFLEPPRGLSPEATLLTRLVALPDGGLVVTDSAGYQFLILR